MLARYHPGATWLHKLPPGLKLALLGAAGLALFPVQDWRVLAGCAVLVLAAYASLGRGAAPRLLEWRPMLPLLAVVGLVQALVDGPAAAAALVLRLAVLVLLADLVTLTTTMNETMGAIMPLVSPLRHVGLRPKRLSLCVALVFRFMPLLLAQWRGRDEAWRARSARRLPPRLIALFLGDALRLADRMAEALDARGFDCEPPTKRGSTPRT